MNKGTLKNVRGDVTEPLITFKNEIVIIPHCCNNLGKMGKGVALSLKKKWGKVYNIYKDMKTKNIGADDYLLGDISCAMVEFYPNITIPKIIVVNMIGQDGTVSKDNPIPIKYQALVKCMEKIKEKIKRNISSQNKPVIHCCKFGSDLAGGNFDFILELIRELWLEHGLDVVIYEWESDKDKWGEIV